MIHTAELDLSQFGDDDSTSKPVWFDVFNYWNTHGYPVETITSAHTAVHAKPDGEDTAHVVVEVETLSRPIDEADVAADTITKWACDCKAYQFHHSVDLEDKQLPEWAVCKHIEAANPTLKAERDSDQTEL